GMMSLESGQPVLDVRRVADLAGLAVADDIEPDLDLPEDDLVDGLRERSVELGRFVRLAPLLAKQEIEDRRRARQAADVSRQDRVRAAQHRVNSFQAADTARPVLSMNAAAASRAGAARRRARGRASCVGCPGSSK